MKKSILSLLALSLLVGCTSRKPVQADFTISVKNPLAFDREELVEIPMSDITERLPLVGDEQYVVTDGDGNEVGYQISFDSNLMFAATVKGGATATYTVAIGTPADVPAAVYGRHYPERVDDIAWENDLTAYRCYGPALQRSGEKAFGYDVWVKNTPTLVVEERYANELNPDTQAEIAALRKARKFAEADELYHSVSYHVDNGNGNDCYKVGPTLGGGVAALLDQEGNIVYPYCWKEYEIMENGPLRFMVKLTYNPEVVDGDTVVETRVVSLAKGSQLNKTVVTFQGLDGSHRIAAGLVVHPENTTDYVLEQQKGYIGYKDLTDNIHNDNGEIYVGIVSPSMQEATMQTFGPKEAAQRGATGHVLAVSTIDGADTFTYWWGSAWSKAGWRSTEEWSAYLDDYAKAVAAPFEVKY